MNNNNFCPSCGVKVSQSLRYCPLCGKYVAQENDKPCNQEKATYPKVDQSYTLIEKWIKKVRAMLVLVGAITVAVNLFFKTKPYWFPYVLVGLFALWRILFHPFKEGKSHVSSLPMSGIVLALLLIFIDVYNYYFTGATLGWGLMIGASAVLSATAVVSFVVALTNHKFEESLTKGIVLLTLVNLGHLLAKLIWFNSFKNWPIFMGLMTCFVALCLLFIFKRKRLVKELNRSFHI